MPASRLVNAYCSLLAERDWSLLMAGCQELKFDNGATILAFGDTSADAPFRYEMQENRCSMNDCDRCIRARPSVLKGCVHATRAVPSIAAPVVVRILKVTNTLPLFVVVVVVVVVSCVYVHARCRLAIFSTTTHF